MNEIEEFIVHMNGHAPGHASLTSAAVDRLRLLYAEIDTLRIERDEWRREALSMQEKCGSDKDDYKSLKAIAGWALEYNRVLCDGAAMNSPTMKSVLRGLMKSVRYVSDEFRRKYSFKA